MHRNSLRVSFILGLMLFVLVGCVRQTGFEHIGQAFTVPVDQTISVQDLDKQYRQFIRKKTPVRITGTVKYQCQIRGAWAFLEQGEFLVFIDFASTSPNILLLTKKVARPLIVEGTIFSDDTVLKQI